VKLAIIGTAGRLEDGKKLNLAKWNDMKRLVAAFVKDHDVKHVVSGGAAFSDHLSVGLYLAGLIDHLDLMLPCEFDMKEVRFFDTGEYNAWNNPGGTSNFYHQHFSAKILRDSLGEIAKAITKGAAVTVGHGFKDRNTIVAKADMMIAFTFGDGPQVKDGGTADTCRKYLTLGGKSLYHVDLNTMKLHSNAVVP
jgi:hypothetical protein